MSGRGGIGGGQPRPGPPRPPMPQLAASMRGRGRATRPPGPPGTPSIRAPTFPAGVVPPVTDPYIPRNPLDVSLNYFFSIHFLNNGSFFHVFFQ